MESLNGTDWDIVVAGTGLQESLLALALSRSGKRILHIDKNDYYGGADASFSLQEAEAWAKQSDELLVFTHKEFVQQSTENQGSASSKLSFPRAYSLALAPQIVYTRSALLPALVSSRVDTQLEFLAVGSWWIYSKDTEHAHSESANAPGVLIRVPSGREDVFADQSIEPKSKRALMRFLRFISDYENQSEIWHDSKQQSLSKFLLEKFALSASVQQPIIALSLLSCPPSQILTSTALPRIARHLRSIGVFGPGFGAVIPKWGGLSEITQVACRASAVGGGVYVLGNGLDGFTTEASVPNDASTRINLKLKSGDLVSTRQVVASQGDFRGASIKRESGTGSLETACRSISIISSPLLSLFPSLAEGAPIPAAAVIVFPGSSASSDEIQKERPQIYISVHSSDTGECPVGQSVLYSSITATAPEGFTLLDESVSALLQCVNEPTTPSVLWKLQYAQQGPSDAPTKFMQGGHQVMVFPAPSLDLAFDDTILERVEGSWRSVSGDTTGEFLRFPPREGLEAEPDTDME